MIDIATNELAHVVGGGAKECFSDIKVGAGAGAVVGGLYGGRLGGWRGVVPGIAIGTFGSGLFTAGVSAACHGRR